MQWAGLALPRAGQRNTPSLLNPKKKRSQLYLDAYRKEASQRYVQTTSKLGGGTFSDSSTGLKLFGA